MRRLSAFLLSAVLLCGCSGQAETLPVFPAEEVDAHYAFEVAEEGVWVYCDRERTQLLDADTAELLSHDNPVDFLTHDDFDFDQYHDLFVPELLGRPNIPGKYFHFDAKTGLFVPWEELNEIGYISHPNDADRTLSFTLSGSAVDYKATVYKWQDETPVMVNCKRQYAKGDEIYIDSYTYENGDEELYQRERVLLSENGTWLGTEEVDIGDITTAQE